MPAVLTVKDMPRMALLGTDQGIQGLPGFLPPDIHLSGLLSRFSKNNGKSTRIEAFSLTFIISIVPGITS